MLHRKGASVRKNQIETALKYLLRVPARGHEEEAELFTLIQSLVNDLNSPKYVYTNGGKTAA